MWQVSDSGSGHKCHYLLILYHINDDNGGNLDAKFQTMFDVNAGRDA